jgi:hypothetical protein
MLTMASWHWQMKKKLFLSLAKLIQRGKALPKILSSPEGYFKQGIIKAIFTAAES